MLPCTHEEHNVYRLSKFVVEVECICEKGIVTKSCCRKPCNGTKSVFSNIIMCFERVISSNGHQTPVVSRYLSTWEIASERVVISMLTCTQPSSFSASFILASMISYVVKTTL